MNKCKCVFQSLIFNNASQTFSEIPAAVTLNGKRGAYFDTFRKDKKVGGGGACLNNLTDLIQGLCRTEILI